MTNIDSILDRIIQVKKTQEPSKQPTISPDRMSRPEADALFATLRAEKRFGVVPNKTDRNRPYRVCVPNSTGRYVNHGYFTSVDVATAVAALCSTHYRGVHVKAGNFDRAISESHPEFDAWMKNTSNAAVVSGLSGEIQFWNLVGSCKENSRWRWAKLRRKRLRNSYSLAWLEVGRSGSCSAHSLM